MTTLNRFCTWLFDVTYGPMAGWPPWASLGVISAVIGVVMLLAYKYTSWQSQIGKARDEIRARMLAMRLFKDNLGVTLTSQGGVIWSSLKILFLSIPPILVAMIPMIPLLAQLAGRYQFAPLAAGKPTYLRVWLTDEGAAGETEGRYKLALEAPEGVLVDKFWRSADSKEAWWEIRAEVAGQHVLTVRAGESAVTKELAVGPYRSITDRISPKRTSYYAGALDNTLMLPWEPPPPPESGIRAIEITELLHTPAPDVLPVPVLGNWIVYFLVVSIVFALIVKPVFNVRI